MPSLRVVGGSARGRHLLVPPGSRTRPTTDRVREAIMNALWSRGMLEDAAVLDLFAGSGALGIEALSRGAARAVFVDEDPRARETVVQNLAVCGVADRAEVLAGRAERLVARWAQVAGATRFDVAFCDPPYAFEGWKELLEDLPAGFAVVESDREIALPEGWDLVRSARYGATWVGFAERLGAADQASGADTPQGGRAGSGGG